MSLAILKRRFQSFDLTAIFDMFSKQLALLKESEGRDLKRASLALKDCIRLAILFITFLYEYYASLTHIELKCELLECVDAGNAMM